MPQDGNAIWPFKKKKKEEKKEVLTPYQKLFKNKKVQTAHGLMTIHKVEDKVYVEFPVVMLGRELLLTSSIENTSDGGEGAPGQLGGTDVRLRFEMIDSTIVARMPLLSKPVNTSGDSDIARALNHSHKDATLRAANYQYRIPIASSVPSVHPDGKQQNPRVQSANVWHSVYSSLLVRPRQSHFSTAWSNQDANQPNVGGLNPRILLLTVGVN